MVKVFIFIFFIYFVRRVCVFAPSNELLSLHLGQNKPLQIYKKVFTCYSMCTKLSKKLNQAEGTRKLTFSPINNKASQMKAFQSKKSIFYTANLPKHLQLLKLYTRKRVHAFIQNCVLCNFYPCNWEMLKVNQLLMYIIHTQLNTNDHVCFWLPFALSDLH